MSSPHATFHVSHACDASIPQFVCIRLYISIDVIILIVQRLIQCGEERGSGHGRRGDTELEARDMATSNIVKHGGIHMDTDTYCMRCRISQTRTGVVCVARHRHRQLTLGYRFCTSSSLLFSPITGVDCVSSHASASHSSRTIACASRTISYDARAMSTCATRRMSSVCRRRVRRDHARARWGSQALRPVR